MAAVWRPLMSCRCGCCTARRPKFWDFNFLHDNIFQFSQKALLYSGRNWDVIQNAKDCKQAAEHFRKGVALAP